MRYILAMGTFLLWTLIVGFRWIPAGPVGSIAVTQYPVVGEGAAPPLWVQPDRRPPDVPPDPPSPLPARARDVTPHTLDTILEVHNATGERRVIRRTISRTVDRIHVMISSESEWLFERNIRDARRVAGFRVEHALETIIFYDESDLREALGAGGWAQVLTFGLDPAILGDLEPTRETKEIGDMRFLRYRMDSAGVTQEVWWSEEQAMPSNFTTVNDAGLTRFSIENVEPGVRSELLRSPASRFPNYRLVDLADWLEARH